MKQVVKTMLFLLFMFLLCVSYTPSHSHPGRTDKKGGHRDSKTGKYHYHNDSDDSDNPKPSYSLGGSGC